MRNDALKRYWAGYESAKEDVYECGLRYALDQYTYGLNGCSNQFCKGYRAYLDRVESKGVHHEKLSK